MRMHGKDCRVYLGGRNASGDIVSISPKFGAATHDTTTFASGGWVESDSGLLSWNADLEGFYDPAVGGFGQQMEALLGATGGILSVYDGAADAIGDAGVLFGDALLENRDQPISVADLIKLSGSLRGIGRVGFNGRLLHVLGEETISGQSASLNNLASSANGARANLHVTAVTGSWTIKIEHSNDNGAVDPWTALVTFTQVTAAGGVTAETKEVVGTVKQYLRATFTEDVAGSCTFIVGLARY